MSLALSPSVHSRIFPGQADLGHVNRSHEGQLDPGGARINVVGLAQRLDWPTVAAGHLAGAMRLLAECRLDNAGGPAHSVWRPGTTRLNISVAGEGTWLAEPPRVQRCSTVDWGDSLVAELTVVLAEDQPIVAGWRQATVAGAATAIIPGPAQPVRALLPPVQFRERA